jgi:cytoskeletal protein RodZ
VELPENYIYRLKFADDPVGRKERHGKIKTLPPTLRTLKGLTHLSKNNKGMCFLVWWEMLNTDKEIRAINNETKESKKKEREEKNKNRKTEEKNKSKTSTQHTTTPTKTPKTKSGRAIIPKKRKD